MKNEIFTVPLEKLNPRLCLQSATQGKCCFHQKLKMKFLVSWASMQSLPAVQESNLNLNCLRCKRCGGRAIALVRADNTEPH